MIAVFMESSSHAELVALFKDEEAYEACSPALEALAEKSRMFVTDSEDYDFACLESDWNLVPAPVAEEPKNPNLDWEMSLLEFHREGLQKALLTIPDQSVDNDMWYGVELFEGELMYDFDINVYVDEEGELHVNAYNVFYNRTKTQWSIKLDPIFTEVTCTKKNF